MKSIHYTNTNKGKNMNCMQRITCIAVWPTFSTIYVGPKLGKTEMAGLSWAQSLTA